MVAADIDIALPTGAVFAPNIMFLSKDHLGMLPGMKVNAMRQPMGKDRLILVFAPVDETHFVLYTTPVPATIPPDVET